MPTTSRTIKFVGVETNNTNNSIMNEREYIMKDSKLLLAMSLGDGHIKPSGHLVISHCSAQKDYIDWKFSKVKHLCTKSMEPTLFDNNGYPAYRFSTKSSELLKNIRRSLYGIGGKVIKPKHIEKIGVLGLAIIYMDDGSLYAKKKRGKVTAHDIVISTYYSEIEDCLATIETIKSLYNITFSVKRNKGKFSLRCGTIEARKFIELVSPYIKEVPSMHYKIRNI